MKEQAVHWADINAEKIIREKGDKGSYVCASGITPSGTVHIGNFREIISVELVVRALRSMGKKVRFIYSWDDYDVFRKVPENMPKRDELEKHLRKPIIFVPDPYGKEDNYAIANEKELESLLHIVGIDPEYLYQAKKYRASVYAQGIRTALEKREAIRMILDEHRTSPLESDWWPVSVFCTACLKDTVKVEGWDGEWGLTYQCMSCGNRETVDLTKTPAVKLLWRIDWPMRWAYEGVDFEPAGKDHHSEGGSFDTARKIVKAVYGAEPPVTFQYDFISIKGRGGKISSSMGEVLSLKDVLEIYQPEVIRYLFAGTRPNTEFAISFDLDVLKIYEDYDKCERIYFGAENVGEKRREKEKRIYELSQVSRVPDKFPLQVPFRHLCNLLQIHSGSIDEVLCSLGSVTEDDKIRLKIRARCAWNWITTFAPEDFRFALRVPDDPPVMLTEPEKKAVKLLKDEIREKLAFHDEKTLAGALYGIAEKSALDPKDFFKVVYKVLIGKEKGPRLASFILTVGKDKILKVLEIVLSTL
ncbi:MAG: lysine--tRNA ligase [Spirochaetota bacterium]